MKSNSQLKIILASASPRRLHILQEHGLSATVMPADIDEILHAGEDATTYVTRLAREKAHTILQQVSVDSADLILAADTTVAYQNHILEKPKDPDDAFRMLHMLSGNTHEVYTGYALIFLPEQRLWVNYVRTKVSFNSLSEQQIESYIDSGDPFDKAGGYGIQQVAGTFVKAIDGSYFNVMGLPIEEIMDVLAAKLAP